MVTKTPSKLQCQFILPTNIAEKEIPLENTLQLTENLYQNLNQN